MTNVKVKEVKLEDLRLPIELWNALDGDPTVFVTKLRSDERLTRPERDCLAFWLENGRKPPARKRGRPSLDMTYGVALDRAGYAAFRYRFLREFIRWKGWHLKRAGRFYWSADRLKLAVAAKSDLTLATLENRLRRNSRLEPRRESMKDCWVTHLEKRSK